MSDHAQEIEILPVEPARNHRTTEDDQPRNPFKMGQRHHRPGVGIGQQPVGQHVPLTALVPTFAHIVQFADEIFTAEEDRRIDR